MACRERFELSIVSDGEAENGDAHVSSFLTLPLPLFLTVPMKLSFDTILDTLCKCRLLLQLHM